MARLIDADALLEQYNLKDATKYGNKDAEQQAHSYNTMMLYEIADMIDGAPTAYDTDKVVEQSNDKFRVVRTDEDLEWNRAMDGAITIVEGGGVDAKTDS